MGDSVRERTAKDTSKPSWKNTNTIKKAPLKRAYRHQQKLSEIAPEQ